MTMGITTRYGPGSTNNSSGVSSRQASSRVSPVGSREHSPMPPRNDIAISPFRDKDIRSRKARIFHMSVKIAMAAAVIVVCYMLYLKFRGAGNVQIIKDTVDTVVGKGISENSDKIADTVKKTVENCCKDGFKLADGICKKICVGTSEQIRHCLDHGGVKA